MTSFFDYQNNIEGLLIISAILVGSYFLFTDNILYFEKKSQDLNQVNSVADSVNKVRNYFADLFSSVSRLLLGNMFDKSLGEGITKENLFRFSLTIPIVLLLLSVTGFIGKSISSHWMDQNNGFHFGLKNFWAPVCSVDDYFLGMKKLGLKRVVDDSLECIKRTSSDNTSCREEAKCRRMKCASDCYQLWRGFFASGTFLYDDDIKVTSFDDVFHRYSMYENFQYLDTLSLTYPTSTNTAAQKDTFQRYSRKILYAIKKKDLNTSQFNLSDSVYYAGNYKTLITRHENKDTSFRQTVSSYMYSVKRRDKIELYHYSKNYFLQNADGNKEVIESIKSKESIINFSRTLALAFYILFLFLFLNLIICISRSFNRYKRRIFFILIIVLITLFIFKLYYILNLATLLVIMCAIGLYFYDYKKYGSSGSDPDLKNARKARRLSLLLSAVLTLVAISGYIVASVNWKFREDDSNKFILGNFKNVILNPALNTKIARQVYGILLPASEPGVVYKVKDKQI